MIKIKKIKDMREAGRENTFFLFVIHIIVHPQSDLSFQEILECLASLTVFVSLDWLLCFSWDGGFDFVKSLYEKKIFLIFFLKYFEIHLNFMCLNVLPISRFKGSEEKDISTSTSSVLSFSKLILLNISSNFFFCFVSQIWSMTKHSFMKEKNNYLLTGTRTLAF